MVTNKKIERKKNEIAKIESKIAELKERLREQKQELTALENVEIVAMYRRETITEDSLPELRHPRLDVMSDSAYEHHDGEIPTIKDTMEEKTDAFN